MERAHQSRRNHDFRSLVSGFGQTNESNVSTLSPPEFYFSLYFFRDVRKEPSRPNVRFVGYARRDRPVRSATVANKITLSGDFVPFQEVDVHAKVSGYIQKICVDVADHVKTGQLLAVLEVPELSAQLQGAEGAVHRSEDAIKRRRAILAARNCFTLLHILDYTRLKQASDARPGMDRIGPQLI